MKNSQQLSLQLDWPEGISGKNNRRNRLSAGKIPPQSRGIQAAEPQRSLAVEYSFRLPDLWSRQLLLALLKRHGIVPYRSPGQQSSTVKARMIPEFVDQTLWPEYKRRREELRQAFDRLADEVISQISPELSFEPDELPLLR